MLRFSRWYAAFIIIVSVLAVVIAALNFTPRSFTDNWPFKLPRYALGLDLQGGSHLLLQVDTDAVRRDRLTDKRDEVRRAILEQPRINIVGAIQQQGDVVTVRVRDESQFPLARARFNALFQPIGSALALGATIREVDISEPEPGLFRFRLTEPGLNERIRASVDQSIEIVRRRVDQIGTTEPSIARQGRDRILVQVPGLQDPEQLKRLLGQTAKLTFRLVDQSMTPEQAAAGRAPPDSELLPSREGGQVLVYRQVMVSGEDLNDAQPGFDQRTNEPIVTFRFNTAGARRFAAVTQENVGRPFAIVLDNQVISAPVIREPILGGAGQISGNFTPQTANELAVLLRAGALPAPLITVEERTVGPGLGADSIEAGKNAAYVALVLVVVFMVATYGFLGFLACIGLFVHVAIIFTLMAMINATLTLPGIAGIVLTMGMAVDSNVLIYERIREEVRLGKSAISAIESGFTRAMGTIWDANITQFIATVVLYFAGTGPVRGFAVTLGIGILTTVFTAVTLVRLMVAWWVRTARPTRVPI
jgi:preprotein translocase subunit SecD